MSNIHTTQIVNISPGLGVKLATHTAVVTPVVHPDTGQRPLAANDEWVTVVLPVVQVPMITATPLPDMDANE